MVAATGQCADSVLLAIRPGRVETLALVGAWESLGPLAVHRVRVLETASAID